jgi:tetratricopeptide (TPR) repeat protein
MKSFYFFAILFLCGKVYCQGLYDLDSLLKIYSSQPDDTSKVKTLVRISKEYKLLDVDSSIHYARAARRLSEICKWTKGLALAYSCEGDAYEYRDDSESALKCMFKELEIWPAAGFNYKVCIILNNIGVAYNNLGDNKKSMEYYLKALNGAEAVKDYETAVNACSNMGLLHMSMGDTTKGLELLKRALIDAETHGLEEQAANAHLNIGTIFSDKFQFDRAFSEYCKAINVYHKLNLKNNIASVYANIGVIFQFRHEKAVKKNRSSLARQLTDSTIFYYSKAQKLAEEVGNEYLLAEILGNLGSLHLTNGELVTARQFFYRSLKYAKHVQNPDAVMSEYQRLYSLFKREKNYNRALEYYEKYIGIKDSLYGSNVKKEINALEKRYEASKNEALLSKLEQENTVKTITILKSKYLIFCLIFSLLLVVVLGIQFYRQNKLQNERTSVRLEQQLLRAQMNPHFLFNSLANIESFIYSHEPKAAGNYLSKFARLMRLILDNSANEYISLQKEIETLEYYLALQKMRLNDNLDYEIKVESDLDPEQTILPPMLTQPFIENSIEHGFRGLLEKGNLKVSYARRTDFLFITITDNGVGISQSQQSKDLFKEHQSMATKITYERLKHLNKMGKKKMHFEISDAPSGGTTVQFTIPLIR